MSTRTGTRARRTLLDDLGPASCVLYLRISQDRTGEGLGVERQEDECRALAAKLGLAVDRVYVDNDISATNGRARPGFEEMLDTRPEAIVAWHQDRLLRLTSDLERVIALDVPVYTVTSGTLDLATPAGRAVARTVAAWSQYEGEQKATRQRAANVQRAAKGQWRFSRRPYGYERRDGRVEVVEAEAEIVREGYRRYISGETYYTIANDWNARAVPTHNTGGATSWSMARVRELLRNARYAGVAEYRGEPIELDEGAEIEWQPLIDEATWLDYLATREGRAAPSGWSRSRKHLMSGLLICGVCGATMLARPEYRRASDGSRRTGRAYQCAERWCTSIAADDVDKVIEAVIIERLRDKNVVSRIRQAPDLAPVQAELRRLRAGRDNVIDLVGDLAIGKREARAKLEALDAQIAAAEAKLKRMRRSSPLTDLALSRAMPRAWRAMPVLDQRRVVDELGLRVTIGRGRPGRRPLGPNGKPLVDLDRIKPEWIDNAEEMSA